MDEEQRTDGMESPDVNVTRLDGDDERAIEFRERLRSWLVLFAWRVVVASTHPPC
jgi:hypothetical protein